MILDLHTTGRKIIMTVEVYYIYSVTEAHYRIYEEYACIQVVYETKFY